MDAADFIISFFAARSKANVCLASYPNERGDPKHQPVEIYTRYPDEVAEFLAKYDKPGRAVYFCVNTVAGKKRSKAHIAEITCLHTDLDFKNIAVERKKIEAVLARLTLPASHIVFSGNGLHVYWLLAQALNAADAAERVEKALHKLAWVLAGDPAVAEISRVMRLPGSHNSKNGEWKNVEVVYSNGYEYSLEQLEAWLESVDAPLLPAVGRSKGNGAATNDDPFVRAGEQAPKEKHVDVEERLAQMQYKGPGETSVHITQRDVIASMIGSGDDPQEVVEYVLAHTKQLGLNWNWKNEERKLRGLCAGMFKRDAGLFEEKYADKVIPDWLKHRLRISDEKPQKPDKKEAEPPKLDVIYLEDLQQMEVKEREWIVDRFILAGQLNGLFGDGGVGKDYILLQLAIAMACGGTWLGYPVKQGKVIYCPVEDHLDEVRRREDRITNYLITTKAYDPRPQTLMILPLLGKDPVLAVFDGRAGRVQSTPMWKSLRQLVTDFQPELVIVGNRVDIFSVSQNDDAQAKQCLHLLGSLCVDFNTTVIMPGHISVRARESGEGTSGSVQWSNGVRLRTLLRRPKDDEDDHATNRRELEVMKTNWGPTGDVISMVWDDKFRMYVPDGITITPKPDATKEDKEKQEHDVEAEFIRLLTKYTNMEIRVSMDDTSRKNAPTMFSRDPTSRYKDVKGRRQFKLAMHRLFEAKSIQVETEGPPSKPRSFIIYVGPRVVK